MEKHGLSNIRNVVLLSHSGAGKTSLAEAILSTAGAISRLGKVDAGTTTSDFDPDEIKRKISINLTMLPVEWQETKINLIDTPGYSDFAGEVKAAVRVSEAAIIVVSAAAGVKVGTEQAWAYSDEAGLSRIIFVNKMDRENADFSQVVSELQEKFGTKCLPLQLPIGAHNDFQGVVDLLSMKAYIASPAKETDIPSSLSEPASAAREKLVEAIAELDDTLLEKYLGGEELELPELTTGLRQAIVSGKIVPVLAGSALQNVAIGLLLSAINSYLPSPKEGEVATIGDSLASGAKPEEDGSLAALVFKTSADPYVGKLTYFRVYIGEISSNSHVQNITRGEAERIGQLFLIRGKTQEPVSKVGAGDIGAVAKLSLTSTGDTLADQAGQVKIAPAIFPKPIFSMAVHPRTKGDLDKLGPSLSRLTEEDPTLHVRREADTGETIMSGLGDVQLDVAAEKMMRKFGVGVDLKIPKVPYKETITVAAKAEYKHRKQTGGHGQYGHVRLSLEPLARGSGIEFVSKVVGGVIPKNYIPAVEKGVNEAVKAGGLAGYPVVDVRATVYDGSFHPVDSSEICFKIAGAQALQKGLADGQPILLEPVVNITVTAPGDFTGDIIGDLNTKRAHVLGMNLDGGNNVIEARVPLAEVLRYTIDLKSITQGRGSYTTEFSHYEEVPSQIVQKLVAQRQAEKG